MNVRPCNRELLVADGRKARASGLVDGTLMLKNNTVNTKIFIFD